MNKLSRIVTVTIFLLICTLQPSHHVQGRVQSDAEERIQTNPYQLPLSSTEGELTPIDQTGGAIYTIQIKGNRAYVGQGPRLISLNVEDPAQPRLLDVSEPMSDIVQSVFVTEDRAYVSDGSDGLWIFDITDPANLAVLGHLPISGEVQSLYVSEKTVYIAAGRGGVLIVDGSDPANLQQVGIYRGATSAGSVAVYDDRLYVADGKNGVKIVDITDPESPSKVSEYTEVKYAHDISVEVYPAAVWAYVTTGQGGMHILDLKEPDSPTLIGVYERAELVGHEERQLASSVAFVADGSGHIYFVDTADPTNPVEVEAYRTGGNAEQAATTGDGKYLYVADGYGGLRILVLSKTDGVSEIATSMSPSWAMNMVFADESAQTAYLADRAGIKIFDMADPANPKLIGAYPTEGDALDLAVHDEMIYVADGPSGLLTLDISDPTSPKESKSYDTSGNAQGIAVNQTDDGKIIAYVAGGSGGLQIIDVSDEPRLIDLDGDLSAVTGVELHGNLLYVTDEVVGLRLIDVTDPTNTNRLSETRTDGSAQDVTVRNNVAYVADGDRGLQLFNIADPALPHNMGHYALPDARGVTVVGMTAYVADGREGLKVIDVRDPAQPRRMTDHKTPGVTENITVHSDQVYLSDGSGGFKILQLAGDEYEKKNDDACEDAESITDDNISQDHNFHKVGDIDWLRFEGEAGKDYIIDVDVPLKSPADVTLESYQDCADANPEKEEYRSFSSGARLDFELSESGPVYFRLANNDPQAAGANVTYQVALRAVAEPPKESAVIIVAGRYKESDVLQPLIHNVTNRAYRIFLSKGYLDPDIKYLAIEDPSLPRITEQISRDALRDAILIWAKEKVKPGNALTLYMMDHGDRGVLYLDEPNNERLSVEDLDRWLTELEDAVPGILINVIIEACYSGSFIQGESATISKNGRIVITSSHQDSRAYASRHGAHFSDNLLGALEYGTNVAESFGHASTSVDNIVSIQLPLLDANGNREPNEPEDMEIAAARGFGYEGSLGGIWSPEIFNERLLPVEKSRSASLDSSFSMQSEIVESSRLIQVEVKDDGDVDSVWALIYPPFYSAPTEGRELVVADVEEINFDKDGDLYTARYDNFTDHGTYRIVIHARDKDGREAAPVALSLQIGEVVEAVDVIYLPFISR